VATLKPWEAYQVYNALKLHFESDTYDALKYNYRTSASQASFLKRKDRFFFAKLAKKYPDRQTLIDFLVSNFSTRTKVWAGNLIDSEADDTYAEWIRKRDSFSYYFSDQVDYLMNHCQENRLKFDDLFVSRDGDHPLIVRLHSAGTISLETLVVFDELLEFMKRTSVTETIFWPEFAKTLQKYRPFFRQVVDLKKCKQIALSRFTN
jgi:hypothetical protein